MRVVVDAGLCAGHGQCYRFHGDLFTEGPLGYNSDRGGEPRAVPADLEAAALGAAHICPEGAITILHD